MGYLSNYPPGVTGNEPQITGGEDEIVLVHNPCGEVFDDLMFAALHGLECAEGSGDNDDWSLQTREMAT